MDIDKRKEQIKNTKLLLQAELTRIIELLRIDEISYGFVRCEKEKAELRNKMLEARRDMLRLDKLLYDFNVDL